MAGRFTEIWFDAHIRLQQLADASDRDGLDRLELESLLAGWRAVLGMPVMVSDVADWASLSREFRSPSNGLLQEMVAAQRVSPNAPAPPDASYLTDVAAAFEGSHPGLTMLSEINLRS